MTSEYHNWDDDEYIPRTLRKSSDENSEEIETIIEQLPSSDITEELYFGGFQTSEIFTHAQNNPTPVRAPSRPSSRNGAKSRSKSGTSPRRGSSNKNNSQSNQISVKKGNKMKKFIITSLSIILSLVIIFLGVIYAMLGNVKYIDVDTSWSDTVASGAPGWELASSLNVRNILIIGIDSDGEKRSRSDSMMIFSINRLSGQIRVTSLLRDLYVNIPGRGGDRLNHSYAYGGEELLMRTIESNFRIKIHKFATINFESFPSIIDTMGGVKINLTSAEASYINKRVSGSSFTGGEQLLNGNQALQYSRIRYLDSDFKRTGRQRTVIEALMSQAKGMPVNELLSLMENASPMVSTNLGRLELTTFIAEVLLAQRKPMEDFAIPVSGGYTSKTIRGMAVLVPNLEKNCKELHNFIYGKVPG